MKSAHEKATASYYLRTKRKMVSVNTCCHNLSSKLQQRLNVEHNFCNTT